MTDPKEIWQRQEAVSGKEVLRERIDSIRDLPCYAGLIGVTGARMFQVELPAETHIHRNYLQRFRGVEIQVVPSSDPPNQQFTIILLEKDLTDIFTLFIQDIIEKLHSVSDSQEALTLIKQRISYWKKLFARITGELLSPEGQRGLYGELLILQKLLQQSNDAAITLLSWQGALSANQDFARHVHALEVKTSKAGIPVVNIASEHQLDYSVWDTLHLAVIMVNESAGSNQSLAAQIETIRLILQYEPTLMDEFHQKLTAAGIPPDAVEQYNEITYTVRSCRYFHIHGAFPAIIAATYENTPVSNIKYRIDIGACNSFEVPEDQAIAHLI